MRNALRRACGVNLVDLLVVRMSSSDSKSCGDLKTEWPELVGQTIEAATKKINADRPDLKVEPLPVGTIILAVEVPDRVILWVDTVAEVPRIG
ncbi:hypothetical protein GUJ93_ZPchr0010g10002 [Zizania palustris]|uniref:Uncharacterized protein n=2 Tax=Zizania palustris TaxID=103762 RepID=A0A8J5W8H8_ZIZPA|nr:hypothetical protein GUJ93_ZPchr0010g10002 [Zizania palustris]